jgi:hypothetical protein
VALGPLSACSGRPAASGCGLKYQGFVNLVYEGEADQDAMHAVPVGVKFLRGYLRTRPGPRARRWEAYRDGILHAPRPAGRFRPCRRGRGRGPVDRPGRRRHAGDQAQGRGRRGHLGDPEAACGGTMARLADLGHEVVALYLTRGEAGVPGKAAAEAAALRTSSGSPSTSSSRPGTRPSNTGQCGPTT